jgi:hypothetical protein
MISLDISKTNSANFDFSFTTSDGDKIDLKLFDKVQTDESIQKQNGIIKKELTLKHTFGYEFEYEGNGLSKEDLKEIKEAFKKIKPLLEKFLKQKDLNDKITSNFIHNLKSQIPEIKNDNHLNALKNTGVNAFDEVLKDIDAGLEELKKAKEIFDKLFDNTKKLEIFA